MKPKPDKPTITGADVRNLLLIQVASAGCFGWWMGSIAAGLFLFGMLTWIMFMGMIFLGTALLGVQGDDGG